MDNYVQATMPDPFWSIFIIIGTLGGIIGIIFLVLWMSGKTTPSGEKVKTMGHVWDEDLQEFNNPLPSWWLILFYITLIFGVIYLVLYPGLGAFAGLKKWSSVKQYQEEIERADATYGPIYAEKGDTPIETLVNDKKAIKMGHRLYLIYCTVCHGSDATGADKGYPNLTDNDWLYGGDPNAIEASIMAGRQGMMPAWESILKAEEVENVAHYVFSLNGRDADEATVAAGKKVFDTYCVSCHSQEGNGSQSLGAPNLTDNIWLYGGSLQEIETTIRQGRQGKMPAHGEFLGKDKVHLLAAYVYSLSAHTQTQ